MTAEARVEGDEAYDAYMELQSTAIRPWLPRRSSAPPS